MIPCQVCGEEFFVITSSHLKKHNMTVLEYRRNFPDTPITSKETLEKKSRLNKGKNNPRYGKHHTKEWKEKLSKRVSGEKHPRWVPREERICPFCKGKIIVRVTKDQKFCSQECYNEWKKEYYKTHDHPNKGRPRSEELKQYLHNLFVGKTLNTGRTHFKKGQVPYWKAQGLPNPSKSSEVREKIRQSMIEKWENEEYKTNQISAIAKATCAKPNKAESELLSIIEGICPDKYRYNKGSTIIGHKIPDFVNEDERKLIELFGEPWHEPEEEQERVETFAEEGWDCLVVWFNELKDVSKVESKIERYREDWK